MVVFLQLKQIRLCTIINNYTTEMEELENVKEKIAELIASESINFDEREILELLLKANPEKCAELYFFMKISERLGRIEKRLRYIDDNTDKNRVVSVQIVG
jgi:hypothetical protein